MMTFEKILVATDLSDSSLVAVRHAAHLARAFGAKVLLVHVTELPFDYKGYGLSAETILDMQRRVREGIEGRLREVHDVLGDDIDTTEVIREGSAWHEINALAKDEGVDMIVVGTHGRTGVKHLLLGSTAEKVVRTAPCPVLTVRSQEP